MAQSNKSYKEKKWHRRNWAIGDSIRTKSKKKKAKTKKVKRCEEAEKYFHDLEKNQDMPCARFLK